MPSRNWRCNEPCGRGIRTKLPRYYKRDERQKGRGHHPHTQVSPIWSRTDSWYPQKHEVRPPSRTLNTKHSHLCWCRKGRELREGCHLQQGSLRGFKPNKLAFYGSEVCVRPDMMTLKLHGLAVSAAYPPELDSRGFSLVRQGPPCQRCGPSPNSTGEVRPRLSCWKVKALIS